MITLLNGETWEKLDLLERMYDDSFYYGYLGKNALSSSSCKMLLDSPKTYRNIIKYGSEETQALRDGRLFHTMILEPHKLDQMTFVDVQSKNTKAFKEASKESREVYTTAERREAERLADNILRNEAATQIMYGATYEVPEIKVIADIPFRVKADIHHTDYIADLKTTTDVNSFKYSANKYNYDLQAYLYKTAFGVKDFIFVCIDKKSCDIAIFECSEEFYLRGEEKLMNAIDTYKYFFQQGGDLDQYVLRGKL